jgi:hypothetical protein
MRRRDMSYALSYCSIDATSRLSSGGIPTDSFWSFSMYEPTADGQRFFVANPISRDSIGNRTRGLALSADGSLQIAMRHDAPPDGHLRANWLPTPPPASE